jgi:hypothetical protein
VSGGLSPKQSFHAGCGLAHGQGVKSADSDSLEFAFLKWDFPWDELQAFISILYANFAD